MCGLGEVGDMSELEFFLRLVGDRGDGGTDGIVRLLCQARLRKLKPVV